MPKALLESDGNHFEVFTRSAEKFANSADVLNPRFFNSSFEKFSTKSVRREARKLARIAKDKGINTFVIYEGGLLELGVAVCLASEYPGFEVIFNFHYSNQWVEFLKRSTDLMDSYLHAVTDLLGNRLILTAESNALALIISDHFGSTIRVFPVFSTLREQVEGSTQSPLRFSEDRSIALTIFVGDNSQRDFALRVANEFANSSSQQVRVHISAQNLDIGSEMSAISRGVKVSSGYLAPAQYFELLQKTAITMLAYDPAKYAYHSSGRIEDSFLAGSAPVVPFGTSLSTQGGEVLTYNNESAFETVQSLISYWKSPPEVRDACEIPEFRSWVLANSRMKGASKLLVPNQVLEDLAQISRELPTEQKSIQVSLRDILIHFGLRHQAVSRIRRVFSMLLSK
jgi:hypothetical protein